MIYSHIHSYRCVNLFAVPQEIISIDSLRFFFFHFYPGVTFPKNRRLRRALETKHTEKTQKTICYKYNIIEYIWSLLDKFKEFFKQFGQHVIILILPFATADCERSFSAMNRIKSPERNKLRDILMDLLLLYDITPEEKAKLDINKLAYDIIHNVWKYEKKDLLDPKLQQNVNQMYSMMFVWSYYIL